MGTSDFIEKMIREKKFSPAARSLPLSETIRIYNETNCLSPDDRDYLAPPQQ